MILLESSIEKKLNDLFYPRKAILCHVIILFAALENLLKGIHFYILQMVSRRSRKLP